MIFRIFPKNIFWFGRKNIEKIKFSKIFFKFYLLSLLNLCVSNLQLQTPNRSCFRPLSVLDPSFSKSQNVLLALHNVFTKLGASLDTFNTKEILIFFWKFNFSKIFGRKNFSKIFPIKISIISGILVKILSQSDV